MYLTFNFVVKLFSKMVVKTYILISRCEVLPHCHFNLHLECILNTSIKMTIPVIEGRLLKSVQFLYYCATLPQVLREGKTVTRPQGLESSCT